MANHAVDNGVLQSVSPSQVNTFRMCARRWRLAKVERIPEPEPDPNVPTSSGSGTIDHAQMDAYSLSGTPPTSPSCLLAITDPDFPPAQDPALLVEHPEDYNLGLTAAGVPVRGKIDLVDPRDPKHVRVIDHKTKSPSSFKKKLTPAQLRKDAQGLVYQKWAHTKFPETEATSFTHLNLKRVTEKDPKPEYKFVSSGPMTKAEVDEAYATEFEAVVEEMKTVAALPTWQEAEPTWSACFLYPAPAGAKNKDGSKAGGCPFQSMCNEAKNSVSVSQGLADLFAGEEDGT